MLRRDIPVQNDHMYLSDSVTMMHNVCTRDRYWHRSFFSYIIQTPPRSRMISQAIISLAKCLRSSYRFDSVHGVYVEP